MATKTPRQITGLQGLVPLMQRADGFAEVVAALQRGESAAIDGAWGSSCALATAALASKLPAGGTLLVVLPRIGDVDDFAGDLAGLLDEPPLIFPAWESLPQEYSVADTIFGGRLRVLGALDKPTDHQPTDDKPTGRGQWACDNSPPLQGGAGGVKQSLMNRPTPPGPPLVRGGEGTWVRGGEGR